MFTLIAFGIYGLFALIFIIAAIIHIVNDAPLNNQSPVLWIILTLVFTTTGFSIYKFVTGKTMGGLFWLLGLPIILSVLFGGSILLDMILFDM